MRKTLFVLCHARSVDCEPLERTLVAAGVPRLDLGLGHNKIADDLTGVLEAMLANHGLALDKCIPDEWAHNIQDDFEELSLPPLGLFLQGDASAMYVSGTANAILIDLWRAVCAKLDLAVRFIYVRHFGWVNSDSINTTNLLSDFNVAAAVIRQHGSDILCFDVADWGATAETAERAVWRLVQGGGVSGGLPAQTLSEGLRVETSKPMMRLPYELQMITDLFAGQHFGTPLMWHNGREDVELVCRFAARDSAIFHLLGSSFCSLEKNDSRAVSEESSKRSDKDAWRDLVFELKGRLESAETLIREFQAVDHDTRKGAPAQQKKASVQNVQAKPKNPPSVVKKSVTPAEFPPPTTELTPFERKWRKFRRDPALFFADAKNPMVRGVGGLFWRRT